MQFSIAKPEEVGVSSAALSQTLDYLAQRRVALHSLLVMRHDALICEGYAAPFTKRYAASYVQRDEKPCVAGCRRYVRQRVSRFGRPYRGSLCRKAPLGGPSPELARLTIRDMLRMATPYNGTTYKRRPTKDWVGSFFTARTDHEPGSFFCYDTSSSHTLCALVEKRMGRPYWMCCAVRALDAIGFSEQSYCIRDPMGISQGGSGLMATPGYAGAAPSCCAGWAVGWPTAFTPRLFAGCHSLANRQCRERRQRRLGFCPRLRLPVLAADP